MNRHQFLFIILSLFFAQSWLLGALRKPPCPKSTDERLFSESRFVDEPQISPDCNHIQCQGCGFYLNKAYRVAQNFEDSKNLCLLRKDNLEFLDLYLHIKYTIEHLCICAHENANRTFRFVSGSLSCAGIDIKNYLIEQKNGQICNTMLHEATNDEIYFVFRYFLNLFIQMECDINIHASDYFGETPLHIAANFGNLRYINELVLNKASLDAYDDEILTPIHRAFSKDHTDVVCKLLDKFDAKLMDGRNNTYLHYAIKFGNDKSPRDCGLVSYLIKHVDPNAQNIHGNTALHLAVLGNKHKFVHMLLQNFSTIIGIQNDKHKTPYELANYFGYHKIINLFRNQSKFV